MYIRNNPGILFLAIGLPVLAIGSLLRRTVLPIEELEFVLVSGVSLLIAVLITYILYDPE